MTILEDEFLNQKLLHRIKKEFQQEQLEKTMVEIDKLNEIQQHILMRERLIYSQREELKLKNLLKNAR